MLTLCGLHGLFGRPDHGAGSAGLLERGFTRGVPASPSPAFVRTKLEEVFIPRCGHAPLLEPAGRLAVRA